MHILKKGTARTILTVAQRGESRTVTGLIHLDYQKLDRLVLDASRVRPAQVIFDEAQELRLRGSKRLRAAHHVAADAIHRLD